ncbi:hypothetical protein LWI29_037977 [Acer saccharum]|uniref:Uncharacterized protein n=1 Tax=Acer saccharum TaxID=4024 RepID=A0AA39T9Q4_ACESA|nr:hypothetical protein LWI29_037977 [Acer saccharum]
MSMENVGEKRCLQLSELEELRLESFENSRIFKEKMKKVARQKNSTQGAKGGSKGVFLQLKIEVILGQAKESLDGNGLKKKYLAREVTVGKNQRSRRKELVEVHRDFAFAEKCSPCCMYELAGKLQDSP